MVGAQGFITPCPIGLDYAAVVAIAKTLDMDLSPAMLHKLQAIEFFEIKRSKEEYNGSE